LDQPGKWPGGNSGITLGHGYDLGFVTEEEFEKDWRHYLSSDQMDRLKAALGVRGERAKSIASIFSDIKIRLQDADAVFCDSTLPKFESIALRALPGLEKLPEDIQGALISLIYNRGADMSNTDRRKEMRAIRDLVANYDENSNETFQKIADQIRLMKRLWEGQNLNGLLRRRDAEASLIESYVT
jgi:hypothetical protein